MAARPGRREIQSKQSHRDLFPGWARPRAHTRCQDYAPLLEPGACTARSKMHVLLSGQKPAGLTRTYRLGLCHRWAPSPYPRRHVTHGLTSPSLPSGARPSAGAAAGAPPPASAFRRARHAGGAFLLGGAGVAAGRCRPAGAALRPPACLPCHAGSPLPSLCQVAASQCHRLARPGYTTRRPENDDALDA